jgi:hypothetical protein
MQISLEVRNGILIAFGAFLWLLLENVMGLHSKYIDLQDLFSWLIILIPLVGIYFTLKHKRDKLQQGTITFIESLRSSSILTATVALSSPLFVWLYVSAVNPTYLLFKQENALKIIRDSQIDTNTLLLREDAIRKSFETFSYILSAFVFALAVCLTLSIVLSILIRKKPLSAISKSDSANTNPVN